MGHPHRPFVESEKARKLLPRFRRINDNRPAGQLPVHALCIPLKSTPHWLVICHAEDWWDTMSDWDLLYQWHPSNQAARDTMMRISARLSKAAVATGGEMAL